MNNEELARSVSEELSWDPKIDGRAVAVSADNGTVTLRGTVGSLRQKREAQKAAERVRGVVLVNNHVDVEILTEERREDADVRGDVLRALMLDSVVPSGIDATVKDGFVTLTGSVAWQHERDEASMVAGNVAGVTGVDDEILLRRGEPGVGNVEHAIKKAFERDAKLDAGELAVTTSSGTVTLTGTVHSWSERDAAVAAAWAAPGVTTVNDRITVTD
jgi:osmotically-inducible protein OsmY